MSGNPKYPSLYQVNTRVWLTGISKDLGRKATLDDIPDTELDRMADLGFDWVWLLSVWATGSAARNISRQNPEWQQEFKHTLPDLQDEDIGGSGFAIKDYKVHPGLGGNAALKRLRSKLQKRNLRLMLDFVPNHMAPDHPWVENHPDHFFSGTVHDLMHYPQNFTRVTRKGGDLILAYGRDPYFDGWPDTLQLDYSNPATVEAMAGELLRISGLCDGVRCDMAMLVLPQVFEQTWGRRAQSFWPEAIKNVREKSEDFVFMAEVYWDMEWDLQQLGFDYTYDKRLYDRLCAGLARPVREHLYAGLDYQDKLARFLENHDEPRAAASFEPGKHEAAAVITFLSPGLRFFHQGQFEGRKKRISPHLVRGPLEVVDQDIQQFYRKLLKVLKNPACRNGSWQLLECAPAGENNDTWDSCLAFTWQGNDADLVLVVVNYAPHGSQCVVKLHNMAIEERKVELRDLMGDAVYIADGNDLNSQGLFMDMPAWGYHVFNLNYQ